MKIFFNLYYKLFGAFNTTIKLVIVLIITSVIMLCLLGQIIYDSNKLLSFSKNELYGVEYLTPLTNVISEIHSYRNMEMEYLQGDKALSEKLIQQGDRVDKALAEMDAVNNNIGNKLDLNEKWNYIVKQWKMIKDARSVDATKSNFESSTLLISNLNLLINSACDNSNITLDPEFMTYYLGNMLCVTLPNYNQNLGFTRDIGEKTLLTHTLSTAELKNLIINQTFIDKEKSTIKNDVDKIISVLAEKDALQTQEINTLLNTIISKTTDYSDLLSKISLQPNNSGVSLDTFTETAFQLFRNSDKINRQLAQLFHSELSARIGDNITIIIINSIIALLGILLTGYLFSDIFLTLSNKMRSEIPSLKEIETAVKKGLSSEKTILKTEKEILSLLQRIQTEIDLFAQDTQKFYDEVKSDNRDSELRINTNIKKLDDILMHNKILTINIATEASKLNEKSQVFIDFSNSLGRLIEKTTQINESFKSLESVEGKQHFSAMQSTDVINKRLHIINDALQKIQTSANNIGQLSENQLAAMKTIDQIQKKLQEMIIITTEGTSAMESSNENA